ncbi:MULTISPECIES: nuclear transport factor 2 family protein [unclassified Achromobacter]|uniref:nuclear transport factor 2 family protein n=1 Tax=unclassified Achromobacter TaxID=2626865 RepID=UPI001E374B0E|nr:MULTISPECIES: nuclear transport factor 2 family protein [unclassified Achromobacter]
MKRLIQRTLFLAALTALPVAYSQGLTEMKTTTQDVAAAQHLIDLHFEIWNDPNPEHWAARFPQVYNADFFVADYAGMAVGYDEVAKLLKRVQGEHAGFTFTPDPITLNHGVGRVTWGYGPQDNPDLVRGEDIFTIENGKLASARVFIDKK